MSIKPKVGFRTISVSRWGGCRKRQKPHYSIRNVSREVVLETIREQVVETIRECCLGSKRVLPYVSAENLAILNRFKPSKVQWALHRLNLEGLVGKGENRAPHDSPRDWMCSGIDSAWLPTFYKLILPRTFQLPTPKPEPEVLPITNVPRGCLPAWRERVPIKKPRFSKRLQRRMWKPE